MKTFILFWNPAISSYKLDDFQRELEEISDYCNNMNWSVWEYDKAHAGDRFFMVRCGNGKTGICMSGYFTSEPYKAEDWSGRGRVTYYMDLEPDVMIHPDHLPILTTSELVSAIPSFDWKGGHSGRLLDEKSAEKLEKLWKSFTEKNEDIFKIRACRQELDPSDYVQSLDNTITCYLYLTSKGELKVYNHLYDINEVFPNIEKAKQYAHDKLKDQEANGAKVVFVFENISDENQDIFSKVLGKFLSLTVPKDYYELISDQYGDEEILTTCLYCLVVYGKETLPSLFKMKFSNVVKDAVKALLPIEGESEEQHLKRIAGNEIANELKLDLLEIELDINKLDEVTIDDVARINKALKTKRALCSDEKKNIIIDDYDG